MRRDIQGLRGVAVLLVVLFHGNIAFAGGYVGVDVFFVISGFVITGVLHRSQPNAGSAQKILTKFYVQRARRLVPALGTVVGSTLIASLLLESSSREQLRTAMSGISTLLFSANLRLLAESDGYFSLGAQTNPFLHIWSLSIEEQFYFVFPLFFLFLYRRVRQGRGIALWTLFFACISLAMCVFLTFGDLGPNSERLAFYLPLTRAWEFLAGTLTYLGLERTRIPKSTRCRRVLIVSGFIGITVSAIFLDEGWSFPGLIALVPVLSTVALLYAGSASEVSLLQWKPFVWLGDRSYGWYLWHWPTIVFALHEFPRSSSAAPIAAVISLVPATLSYTLIEHPIRNRHEWGEISTRLVLCFFVVVPLILSASIAVWTGSADTTYREPVTSARPSSIADCATQEVSCLPTESVNEIAVLVGDSHAGMIAASFDASSTSAGFTPAISSHLGCPFVGTNIALYLYNFEASNLMTTTDCSREFDLFVNWIREVRPKIILLVNNAPLYSQAPGFDERFDLRVACMTGNGATCLPSSSTEERLAYFEERLKETVDELTRYVEFVIVSLPMPQMFREPSQFISAKGFEGTPRTDIDTFRASLLPMYERLLVNPRVTLWDPINYLCTDEVCPNGDGDGQWYSDNGHLGPRGASRLEKPLEDLFVRLTQG